MPSLIRPIPMPRAANLRVLSVVALFLSLIGRPAQGQFGNGFAGTTAAEQLRKLLAAAFGQGWKAQTELELIRASGSAAADLGEWLRNDFFEQHCDMFHQRPFLWHIWDGRKRDGFHALVNYHKLADGDQGRRTLERLTHSYLGDWITRQKDGMKRGEEGADERLAAALALKF